MRRRFRFCKPLMLIGLILLPGVLAVQAEPSEPAFPCGAPMPSASNARAVEEIFGQSVPAGWTAIRSGSVPRASEKGLTLMMQKGQTMALIVAAKNLAKDDPLADRNMARVAYHLFENHVFGRQGYQIVGFENASLAVNGVRVATTRLRIRFSDDFTEPDLIARFHRQGRVFIVLLGQPGAGGHGLKELSFKPYREMERELRGLVQATAPDKNGEPLR